MQPEDEQGQFQDASSGMLEVGLEWEFDLSMYNNWSDGERHIDNDQPHEAPAQVAP